MNKSELGIIVIGLDEKAIDTVSVIRTVGLESNRYSLCNRYGRVRRKKSVRYL